MLREPGGGDRLGEADALDARVVLVEAQGLHVASPFVAADFPGRGKQRPRAAQHLAIGLEALLDLQGDLAGFQQEGVTLRLGVGFVDAGDDDRAQKQRKAQRDEGGGKDVLEEALGGLAGEGLHRRAGSFRCVRRCIAFTAGGRAGLSPSVRAFVTRSSPECAGSLPCEVS